MSHGFLQAGNSAGVSLVDLQVADLQRGTPPFHEDGQILGVCCLVAHFAVERLALARFKLSL